MACWWHLLRITSCYLSSACVCFLKFSYEDSSRTGLRLAPWPHFNVITSLKDLPPNKVLGIGSRSYKFAGTQFSSQQDGISFCIFWKF